MLHLWGATTSRTLRAVWALHELSLDYVAHPILPRTGETKYKLREIQRDEPDASLFRPDAPKAQKKPWR